MNSNGKISVIVSHKEPVIAAGLTAILGTRASVIEVTTEHGPAPSVVDYVERSGTLVDVLVTDYETAIGLVHAGVVGKGARGDRVPRVMVVAQSNFECEIRTALNAGIHGYMLQDCQGEELLNALSALARGERFLSHAVAQCMANSISRQDLTAREQDVLRLLATGSCNKLIARELGIAVGTVKVHVKVIREKLDASTRTHAVVVARQRGLIHPTPSSNRGFANQASATSCLVG